MRATFEKTLTKTPAGEQFLWRVSPDKHAATFATHVITSSVKYSYVRETMAFWANSAGEIIDWVELACAAPGEHVACLEAAGFEVVEHD